MKHILILIIIICPILAAAAEDDNREFLKILDTLITLPGDVVTEIRITTFKDNIPMSEKSYTHFADSKTGQFLLICSSPPYWQGFAYVKRKERIWIYTPVVRIFFTANKYDFIEETGARIEDFLPREYDKNYTIHSRSQTEVNGEPALKLILKAKSESAPYDRMTLWLHEENMLLLKEEMYDAESHLLKTIRYSGFREKDGWYQPSKILITDVLQDNITSLISVKKTVLSPVPEYVFTRSFVEFITR